jgi:hypothetical protein
LTNFYDHGRLRVYIRIPLEVVQLQVVEGIEGILKPVTALVSDLA